VSSAPGTPSGASIGAAGAKPGRGFLAKVDGALGTKLAVDHDRGRDHAPDFRYIPQHKGNKQTKYSLAVRNYVFQCYYSVRSVIGSGC
jgi:hypothetical protein